MSRPAENQAAEVLVRVEAAITPLVTARGLELVDLEWHFGGSRPTLRLYLDHLAKESGITLDECAEVSREAGDLLDVEDVVPWAYTLEVSSPGLDRPLRKLHHFAAVTGQEVKLRLKAPRDGRRNFRGTLRKAEGETIEIEADGKTFAIPLDEVEKAHLVYRW